MASERSVGVRVPLLPPMRTPNTTCFYCKQPCYRKPYLIKTNRRNFCGQECYLATVQKELSMCVCGNTFKRRTAEHRFCSIGCSNKARTGTKYTREQLKNKVLKVQTYRRLAIDTYGEMCSLCGQGPWWNEQPLKLQVDHIDGDRKNNDITNLRVVCPNCHTQTPTYGHLNFNRTKERTCKTSVT